MMAPSEREGMPLEYTEQQRAAFKDAHAKQLRRQILAIVLLFAVMVPLPLIEDSATYFGLSGAILGPLCFVAILIGWVIVNNRTWRCPACNSHLGRALRPRRCRSCGIELRR